MLFRSGHSDLACDGDLSQVLKANRTSRAVGVVKHNGDTSFRNTSLTALVDEILLILRTHLNNTSARTIEMGVAYRKTSIQKDMEGLHGRCAS